MGETLRGGIETLRAAVTYLETDTHIELDPVSSL